MRAQILVVDDEQEIADLLEVYLLNEGYQVIKLYSSLEAEQFVASHPVDLAILDVMMPHIDGLALCQHIRRQYHYPIIMLTAKVEDIDKITGLAVGADDYLTKPFNPLELIARVKAQLRRYLRYNENRSLMDIHEIRGLMINHTTHECTLNGKAIALTPLEFKILWLLCENAGKVVSAEELFQSAWGQQYLESNNTVMVHIRRLREKLGEPRNPKLIKTVWGVGYKLEK